jgi:hypothetical protein
MQKFQYRSPRFVADLPVQFAAEQSTLHGRCRDISRDGMGLELQQPLSPNSSGTISLSHRGRQLQLGVRVAYSAESHEGLEFIYRSDRERAAVGQLVASLGSLPGRPRLVLLK